MEDNLAIDVVGVTKRFRVHRDKHATLKEKILRWGNGPTSEFVALQDVSLSIPKGSTVGLIGVNGSGKSTLLKVISRILYPDTGKVEVRGRVSSLLELGAGFHPDFTGRENIFMNGALLGLSKKEIQMRLEEIISFSELGDFIDQPVRSYSSGMYMRLAFSVAVAVDPEILLIDEILAVGDAAFQAKCMSRIKQLQRKNKTIVMVTHDTGAVERFCDIAVWMHNSRVKMVEEPVTCVNSYLDTVFRASHSQVIMSLDRTSEPVVQDEVNGSDAYSKTENTVAEAAQRYGNGSVRIIDVKVITDAGRNVVRCGESMTVEIHYDAATDVDDAVFGFAVFAENGTQCYGSNTFIDRVGKRKIPKGSGHASLHISKFSLLPGQYLVDLAVHSQDGEPFDYWKMAMEVKVISDRAELGICRIEHTWAFGARTH